MANSCGCGQQELVPEEVQRPTLPCVWPMALRSSSPSEANRWFDQRLHNYLTFLNKDLISPASTHNASCFSFQKLYVCVAQINDGCMCVL